MSSILTLRFLVDDWSVDSISFGPFDTRKEAEETAKNLHAFIWNNATKAEPRSAEPGVKGNGKDT